MSKGLIRSNSKLRKDKTLEEELMELDEQMSSRPALDFQSYQRDVMEKTNPWPVYSKVVVLESILLAAMTARNSGDIQVLTIQLARILRHIAELCDSVPISMERVAHISLSELPKIQGEISSNSENITKIE